MKPFLLALALTSMMTSMVSGPLLAQPPQIRMDDIAAPADPNAIALYPDQPPAAAGEQWSRISGTINGNAIDNRAVRNVVSPTITPHLPDPKIATGAAVIVAPGGAFMSLSMDGEGHDIANWLAAHGVAAFVLKYRLNETPRDIPGFQAALGARMGAAIQSDQASDIKEPRATADALKALALVRAGAGRFGIDPARVGMIGFSAGAMTTLRATLEGKAGERPDFIGYVYGPMLSVAVPKDAPPMFAAIAMDDGLFARQGFAIVEDWRKARRPVELHAYERGDHGFGIGRPGTTTTQLMPEFLAWLTMHGWLNRGAAATGGK
jgi:acetyl esterase/lipase